MSHELVLGGQVFLVSEPCFRDLKVILTTLNQLPTANDQQLPRLLQQLLTALLGACHVAKFRRYRWESWKVPAPTPQEMTDLLAQIPAICGLVAQQNTISSDTANLTTADDWHKLYWRIARVTGWTFSQIDTEMTLTRLTALSEHLLEKPLTDDLVAWYLNYEYQKPRTLHDAIDEMLMTNGADNGNHKRH